MAEIRFLPDHKLVETKKSQTILAAPPTPMPCAMRSPFALSFDGRERWRQSDEQMARITADHLVWYLEMAGYMVHAAAEEK